MAKRVRESDKFDRYDSADYLRTPEDVVEYLGAAFEEGGYDAAYMEDAIGVAARAHSMMELAEERIANGRRPSDLAPLPAR